MTREDRETEKLRKAGVSTRFYVSALETLEKTTLTEKQREQLNKLPVDEDYLRVWMKEVFTAERAKELFNQIAETVKNKDTKDTAKEAIGAKQGDSCVQLRNFLLSNSTFFVDQSGEYYARISVDDHFEILNLDSERFSHLCVRLWETEVESGRLIGAEAVKKVAQSLKSRIAIRRILETRCATYEGAIYYDLCDDSWRQVEITAQGWKIITDSPVYFRRSPTQASQCLPDKSGNLGVLDELLNLESSHKVLFKSILPALLLSHIPRPIIFPYGEEGSGKTLLSWLLKDLIDPTFREKGEFPSDVNDFDLTCEQEYLPLFDNVHKLPPWAEDALSTTVTGRSTIKRKLYTNKDTVITTFKRPVLLNGINVSVKHSDCLQRTLLIKTPPLVESKRKSEKDFKNQYAQAKPKIVGAIFDLLVYVLREVTDKHSVDTRLREFAQATVCASVGLGYPVTLIPEVYQTLQDEQNAQARDASPIWNELCHLADEGFTGTTQQLGARLVGMLPSLSKGEQENIKNAQWLGANLSRLSRQMREEGIAWVEGRKPKTGQRIKSLNRLSPLSPQQNLNTMDGGDNPKETTLSPLVTLVTPGDRVTTPDNPKSAPLSPQSIDDKRLKGDKGDKINGINCLERTAVTHHHCSLCGDSPCTFSLNGVPVCEKCKESLPDTREVLV